MTLRIATWNMNHGFRSPEERQAARGLLAEHNLDFALLQEALPTNAPGKRAVYKPGGISSSRPWGSAVISFGRELKELSELTTRHSRRAVSLYQTAPGSVAVAYVPDIKLTLVSVYGVIEAGYAITTVHRQVSDLTPLFDSSYGRRVILGGDLNLSSQMAPPDGLRHQNLFDRFATLGLVDAFSLNRPPREPLAGCPCRDDPCRHVRTQRRPGSCIPWQNDYVFVSKKFAGSVEACFPVDGNLPEAWELSDHCPVILELGWPQ